MKVEDRNRVSVEYLAERRKALLGEDRGERERLREKRKTWRRRK